MAGAYWLHLRRGRHGARVRRRGGMPGGVGDDLRCAPGDGTPLKPSAVVGQVQEILNDAFGAHIAVDGVFGPQTTSAVRAFQAKNRLPVTGVVDEATSDALQSSQSAGLDEAAAAAPVASKSSKGALVVGAAVVGIGLAGLAVAKHRKRAA